MSNLYKYLFTGIVFIFWGSGVKAQHWSTMVSFSPSSSTLISDASRFGYHYQNWTAYYMRYNDYSYFGTLFYPVIWSNPPDFYKTQMPQDFIITDFKEFWPQMGFIGSYQNAGMYGYVYDHDLSLATNTFHIIKLPRVDLLKRIVYFEVPNPQYNVEGKILSIGERAVSSGYSRSYLMEFFAYYSSNEYPYQKYRCAPLAYDSITHDQEIADDVINLDHFVVFSTRDTRLGHTPVNLRISDTTNVLANSDINNQWQFFLPANRKLVSETRLLVLDDDEFVLMYITYDINLEKCYLEVHKIILPDFLSGNNTIVSHEINVNKDCSNLIEVVFEPDVNTMVILLNGSGRSEIYHMDPFVTTNTPVSMLNYPGVQLSSLKIVERYYSYNADCYMAIGGNELFAQDISSGFNVDFSCLDSSIQKIPLREPPLIGLYKDPLNYYLGEKIFEYRLFSLINFEGTSECTMYQNKKQ